jgi:membrane-bound acyltransferase YfiQ involved in biofilm formation
MAGSLREHICQQLYMLQLSYSASPLKQIHFCCLARGEVVSWQISLSSHEHISSTERVCVRVCVCVSSHTSECQYSSQYSCSSRLLRFKFLISVYIFITHMSSGTESPARTIELTLFIMLSERSPNYKHHYYLLKIINSLKQSPS